MNDFGGELVSDIFVVFSLYSKLILVKNLHFFCNILSQNEDGDGGGRGQRPIGGISSFQEQ